MTIQLKATSSKVNNEPIPEVDLTREDLTKPRYSDPFYRVIIGVDPGRTTRQYLSYGIDDHQRHIIGKVDFDDPESLHDNRFIFDYLELNLLLQHLAKLDDNGYFCMIAQLGAVEIDQITLLPIIRS